MNIVDLRLKFIQSFEQQIKKELSELQTPGKYINREKRLLSEREEENFISSVANKISESEEPTLRNLSLNNIFRFKELQRAMGILLLFSNAMVSKAIFKIDELNLFNQMDENENVAPYTEQFWMSYGDFQIRSCSLCDSIGIYLAFVFFGMVNSPLYYDQVIDSIKLKYTHSDKRIVLDGDPFQLKDIESWKVLVDVRKRYQMSKQWRWVYLCLVYQENSPIFYTDCPELYNRKWKDIFVQIPHRSQCEQNPKNNWTLAKMT